MANLGTFFGIGVGPGASGYIPIAALDVLRSADLIFHPRARSASTSVAKQCLSGLALSEDRFQEIVFNMDSEPEGLHETYVQIAEAIATALRQGKNVAYLTLGDSLTYSTYHYALQALLKILPGLPHKTLPGITSYAAIASAFDWPLGCGKERTLILPCPNNMDSLRADIESHDVVVLMKIGHRLPSVLALIQDMGIANYCVLGSRVGLPGEILISDVNKIGDGDNTLGYLSTMLIRKKGKEQ